MKKFFLYCYIFCTIFTVQLCAAEDSKEFSTDWFSNNIPIWDKYKEQFSEKSGIRCLEIGSWEGRSTIYLAESYCNGQGSTVDALDTWDGSMEHSLQSSQELYQRFSKNLSQHIDSGRVRPHRNPSIVTLTGMLNNIKNENDKYDVIYIDGSHLAKDVLVDAVLSWELLKVGGIMMFDDYTWGHELPTYQFPKTAIDGFLACYKSMYEVLFKDSQVHIRKIRNTPVTPERK